MFLLGMSVHRGGGLCPERRGSLFRGEGVSVQTGGVSVYWGLPPAGVGSAPLVDSGQAGDTHPTGMHSCLNDLYVSSHKIHQSIQLVTKSYSINFYPFMI